MTTIVELTPHDYRTVQHALELLAGHTASGTREREILALSQRIAAAHRSAAGHRAD